MRFLECACCNKFFIRDILIALLPFLLEYPSRMGEDELRHPLESSGDRSPEEGPSE